MKRIFNRPSICLLCSFLFYVFSFTACRKADKSQPPVKNDLIARARAFFYAHLANSPSQTLVKDIVWEKAHMDKNSDNVLIAPVDFDHKVSMRSNVNNDIEMRAEYQTKCVIKQLDDGSFEFNRVVLIPDSVFMAGKALKFSGVAYVERWNGGNASSYFFKDGKVRKLNSGENTPRASTNKQSSITCYYLRTYRCEYDPQFNTLSNCQLTSEHLLGCIEEGGDNEQTDWFEDGGGGGSVDDYTNEYIATADEITTNLESMSENAGSSETQATQDPNSGVWTKRRDYEWWCGTNKFLNWSWKYKSYDRAYLEKANTTAPWLFKTLTHMNLLLADGTTPPYSEVSHALGLASPVIYQDRLDAYMKLSYTVTVKVIRVNSTSTKPLSAYSPTWHAD